MKGAGAGATSPAEEADEPIHFAPQTVSVHLSLQAKRRDEEKRREEKRREEKRRGREEMRREEKRREEKGREEKR